uniref:Uncharacterized protein n=1 Tax=Anguilla anguilla TaxID=7936 RepID=A0A0E9T8G8_ANGAN
MKILHHSVNRRVRWRPLFYHDDTPRLPNFGQMSDYERYHSHKMMSKKTWQAIISTVLWEAPQL